MSDIKLTGHVWTEVFSIEHYQRHPAMPLLITFWIVLFGTILRNVAMKYGTKVFPGMKIGELEIDEDLDNYFHTLDDHDRNWSIKEEEYTRDTLNMKILEDETLDRLKNTEKGESHMKGVHCYDILANPLYLDDFQYFSSSQDNRADYIIDDDEDEGNDNAQSDLVKMVLNLAFLHESVARRFTFNKDTYKNQLASAKKEKINWLHET